MRAWIDLETGGLDAKRNPILQIAVVIEDNGKKLGEFSSYINPHKSLIVEDEAIAVNGLTQDVLKDEPDEATVIKLFTSFLQQFRVHNDEQFEFCGYNSRFDMDFIVEMFKRHKQYRYWDYFHYYDVDVFALVKILGITGERYDEKKKRMVDCKKLECICKLFDIELKAHDAIADINATRKLFKKLKKRYFK